MENLEGSNNKYHCTLGNSENNFEKILPIIKKLCNYLGKKNFRPKTTGTKGITVINPRI